MGKFETEQFPPDAEHGNCLYCGRLLVLSETPVLTVWHQAPECQEFSSLVADLKPTTSRVGVVSVPADWKTR